MATRRSEFFAGIKGITPILIGVCPFGLIYGVSASNLGLPISAAQAMSSIVFAGSSQFVAVQLIGAGAPALVILSTVLVINLRHTLYSASLAQYLKHLPLLWKWLLAYLLVDESYAITITHYQRSGELTNRHWYMFGAGLALWSTWQASTAIGLFLGAQVPAQWSLDFALPLTFIALVVPALKDWGSGSAALAAGVAALLTLALPFKLGLIAATLVGIVLGLSVEFLHLGIPERTRSISNSPRVPQQDSAPSDAKMLNGDASERRKL